MSEKMSRRKFLKNAGIVTAATGVALCGGGAAATTIRQKPAPIISMLQNQNAAHQILVTYATRSGVTSGIAERIANKLSQYPLNIDLLPLDEVTALSKYDTVLIGSGIRMGKYLPSAINFMDENATMLAQKNFGTFFSCMTLVPDSVETRTEADAYFLPIRQIVSPQFEAAFAGAYNPQYLTLTDRLILNALKTPEGDYCNWNAIEDWADTVAVGIL